MNNDVCLTKIKRNKATQSIEQSQSLVQNSLYSSGATTFISCNIVIFQNQNNTGNNALAQQDDNDEGDNLAEQSISQLQSSNQTAR
jgi:hypothetical protein